MRLLLVEDTVALADQLLPLLRDHGYAVDWLADGRDALVRAHDDDFDLVILDLGLPGLDGLEVLQRWREQGLSMPVLILTARDSWAERVDGLRAGADDYLTKPFHPEELLLREGVAHRQVDGVGDTPLAHLLTTVMLGDFVSYYLGILNQVDPGPVSPIDYLKRRLAEG